MYSIDFMSIVDWISDCVNFRPSKSLRDLIDLEEKNYGILWSLKIRHEYHFSREKFHSCSLLCRQSESGVKWNTLLEWFVLLWFSVLPRSPLQQNTKLGREVLCNVNKKNIVFATTFGVMKLGRSRLFEKKIMDVKILFTILHFKRHKTSDMLRNVVAWY